MFYCSWPSFTAILLLKLAIGYLILLYVVIIPIFHWKLILKCIPGVMMGEKYISVSQDQTCQSSLTSIGSFAQGYYQTAVLSNRKVSLANYYPFILDSTIQLSNWHLFTRYLSLWHLTFVIISNILPVIAKLSPSLSPSRSE